MAKHDISVHENPYGAAPTKVWQTEAGATDILAGEPVKLKTTTGSPYVIPLATGDLTIGSDSAMVGIAVTDSTHTASADGTVEVMLPLPGVIYKMAADTAANVDTEAEIKALENDRVVMLLASGSYTLDEDLGDGANNAFYIVGGNPSTGELYFTIRNDATFLSA